MSGYVWRGRKPQVSCQCGCGEPAPIATRTDRRYGAVKGQPRRYISGHNRHSNDMSAARAALAAKRQAAKAAVST